MSLRGGPLVLDGGAAINRGLRAWWPLDEAGGALVRDISIARKHARFVNGPTRVFSPIGRAVAFDAGSAQHVETLLSLGYPNQYTWAFWLWTTTASSTGGILQPLRQGADGVGFSYSHGAGAFQSAAYHRDGGGGYYSAQIPPADLTVSTWHFIVTTWTGSSLAIFHNGVRRATTATAAGYFGATDIFRFGGQNSFTGRMRDVRIWSRALLDREVAQLYVDRRAGLLLPQRRRRKYYFTDAPAGNEGTAAITLGAVTAAAEGALSITGSAAVTLGAVTSASVGSLAIAGSGAITLGAVTAASAGTLSITGAAAATLGDVAASSAGTLAITGSGAVTLGAVTAAAEGSLSITGAAAVTLGDVTLSATGAGVVNEGAVAVTLGDVTAAAVGALAIAGSADITLGDVTASAAGVLAISGTVAATLGAVTLSAVGTEYDGLPAAWLPATAAGARGLRPGAAGALRATWRASRLVAPAGSALRGPADPT